jgi:HPt (histidine-containing phosphotransfer) domain-containing protein
LPQRQPSSEEASTPPPTDLLALEGIDVAGSLHRLGLEYETFKRMLVRFADTQGPMLDALRSAVSAGDGTAAARHAHAIAGSSGNLGADALHAAAKALERAGHEGGAHLPQLLADIEHQAAIVFRSIDRLRGAALPAMAGSGPLALSSDARAVLERLQAALGDFDVTAASSGLADLDRVWTPGDAGGDLVRLRHHVDGYEYEEAQVLVGRLLEQSGSSVS